MSDRQWQGHGPEYTLSWGGRSWSLDLGKADPGLRLSGDGSWTKLLCLDGLAQVGRSDPNAFNPTTLVGLERRRNRIEAVFAPTDWGGLSVRAAWSPTEALDGVDLEVQIGATSVGELKGVEVGVLGDYRESLGERPSASAHTLEPRVATLAGPMPSATSAAFPPWIFVPPGAEPDHYYIEMVQPNDVSRRAMGSPTGGPRSSQTAVSARHALFGHDLERGVILRARLRGVWIRSRSPRDDACALLEEFLREPPPLGP